MLAQRSYSEGAVFPGRRWRLAAGVHGHARVPPDPVRTLHGEGREPDGVLSPPSVISMKIGTLGSGIMTAALVPHWIAAGHDVMIGGRNTEHAHSVAEQLGANAGSLADAARVGDVVLLAVRSEGLA